MWCQKGLLVQMMEIHTVGIEFADVMGLMHTRTVGQDMLPRAGHVKVLVGPSMVMRIMRLSFQNARSSHLQVLMTPNLSDQVGQ